MKTHISTAYHEAGHVVIAMSEGFSVQSISINGDGSGAISHNNPLRKLNLEYDGSDRARIRVEKAARIAIAGLIAERLHNPRSHRPKWSTDDHGHAADCVMSASTPGPLQPNPYGGFMNQVTINRAVGKFVLSHPVVTSLLIPVAAFFLGVAIAKL